MKEILKKIMSKIIKLPLNRLLIDLKTLYPLISYNTCVGRKYRRLPKLYRPFSIYLGIDWCCCPIILKNKIRFFRQWMRFFYKSRWGYYCYILLNKLKKNIINSQINNGDIISICTRTQKAALRKLFSKLNFEIEDYKILKRRQYVVNITFCFFNIEESKEPFLDLHIKCKNEDSFNIFIILNGVYLADFHNVLYFYEEFFKNRPIVRFLKKGDYIELLEVTFFNYYYFVSDFIKEENPKKNQKKEY